MIKDYMKADDVYNELDDLRDSLKVEMEDELTPLFEDMTADIVEEAVANCENTLLDQLQGTTE